MGIEIKIGTSFNDKDIRRAQAELNNLAKITERAGMSMVQRLESTGRAFQTLGRDMTMKVTAPLVAAGAFAVKYASDLQESQSKVNVVFGQSADVVTQFGADAAKSMGMSQAAAFQAAGTYGNLFRAMGLTEQQSAGMSTSMVQLAADLGSFNDVPVDQVFDALRAGLVGETEPLRRFGVNITAAKVQAEALNLGLVRQGEELSDAAKAQAAYSIIMKETTLAQGDFARTSDGAANSMKTARASLEDAAAQIGQVLLPVVSKVSEAVGAFAGFVANLPGPIQTLVVALGGLAAAFGPVVWITGSVMTNLAALMKINWAGNFGRAKEAIGGFSSAVQGGMAQAISSIKNMSARSLVAFGAIGVAIAAAGFALNHFVNEQAENARKRFKTLNVSVDSLRQSFQLLVSDNSLIGGLEDLPTILRDIQTETEGAYNWFIQWGGSKHGLNPLQKALTSVDDNARRARESLAEWDSILANTNVDQAIGQYQALAQQAEDLGYSLPLDLFPQLKSNIETAAGAAGMSVEEFLELAGAGGQVKTEFEQATEALQEWEDEVRSQFDPLFAYGDAMDGVRDAQQRQEEAAWKALDAVAKHGEGSSEAIAAISDYQAAVRDTTSATFDAGFQLERLKEGLQTGAVDFITAAQHLDGLVAAGLMTEEQARLTKDEWRRLADQVIQTPSTKDITLTSNVDSVLAKMEQLRDLIANTDAGLKRNILQAIESRFSGIGGSADGGPVQGGMAGWVGERGPELFIPQVDGTIVPHYQSRRIMDELSRGQQQQTQVVPARGDVNVYVNQSDADPYEIGRELLWTMKVAG